MEEPATMNAAPDSSLSAKVPRGWKAVEYEGYQGRRFRRAIDPDGCRWYWIDGEWILNVPWFRSSRRGSNIDDIAVVNHESGNHLECKITKRGTIYIGKRRIPRRRWNH